MKWFAKLSRIAGVNFPVSASLVQLQAELDSAKTATRLEKLEDPISFLHEYVPAVSRVIYRKLSIEDSVHLNFDEEFYIKYIRPLAALSKKSYISMTSVIGSRIPRDIRLTDPTYILYM